jgi:N-acetylneuraminic acid mutarotase
VRKSLSVLLVSALTFLSFAAKPPFYAEGALTTFDTDTSGLVEDSWVAKTGMPQGGAVYGAVEINGNIYAFGAYYYNKTIYATSGEYDPLKDSWRVLEPMPTPRINFATTVYQNNVYTIGGQRLIETEHGIKYYETSNAVEIYEPIANKWTNATPMASARTFIQANVVSGRIYVIGGTVIIVPNQYFGNEITNTNQVYDPHSNTWTTMASIPNPIEAYSSVVMSGKIYVIGGIQPFLTSSSAGYHELVNNATWIYDPVTDEWASTAYLPVTVNRAVAGKTSGLLAPQGIYVFGYTSEGVHPFLMTQVYDPLTETWINGTRKEKIDLNTNPAIAAFNDTFYLIGGTYSELIPGDTPFSPPNANPPPPFTSCNYRYIPFGYGTLNPIPTANATPSPSPTTQATFDLLSILVTVIAVLPVIIGVGLLVYFKKRRQARLDEHA